VNKLDVFTVRDLREKTGQLIRDAERGRMSLVTKRGRPTFVAVPFDQRLLDLGVQRALAVKLFEEGGITLSQAAKVAGLCLEDFLDVLKVAGVPAVDYPAEELDDEMRIDL
jgi:prevent-host-death family protein